MSSFAPAVVVASHRSALPPADATVQQLWEVIGHQAQTIEQLQQRVEWFTRQIFGHKSERFAPEPPPEQMHLGQVLGELPVPEHQPAPGVQVPGHRRAKPASDFADEGAGASFFDETKVPVHTIEVPNPEVQGLEPDQYEVVGQKVSHRLAQRPGAYVVLRYVRPVVKLRQTQRLVCPPAPEGVLQGSRADVSFVAGLVVDKFRWHLPLYRQHQRLLDAGFRISRPWLTQLVQQAAQLLQPVYEAQLASVLASRVKAVDETPIKAGREEAGKMRTAYFWPVYGEGDEICFAFFESRRHEHVHHLLGQQGPPGAVILSDGYGAYQRYVHKTGATQARCWVHCRRNFNEALGVEPEAASWALRQIQRLYEVERQAREQCKAQPKTRRETLRKARHDHARPLVQAFFEWVEARLADQGLLPSNPLTKALAYARQARAGLEVFLDDADVALDTNHLENAIRPVALGRRNWLFCWTEVGAQHAGMLQSLISTCRLHDIDPYTWFVDVLQRVGQHPDSRVAELTPRQWKQHFADQPLRSALHGCAL
jgi:transposase